MYTHIVEFAGIFSAISMRNSGFFFLVGLE
jgi:hypothetical protein